jgi:hypothetical protein
MLEMCVQQEIHQGKKRYVLSLEDDLGDSLYIMKELKKSVVRLGDNFWSNYWEPAQLMWMIKKYVPESGLAKYSLEQIEKALHFGVAVDMCTTNVQRNQQLEYVSKYRIM